MRAEPITPASGSLRAPSPAPQTDRTKSTLPGVVRPLMSSPFSEAIPHTLHLSTLLGSSELNCVIRVIGAGAAPPHTHTSALPGTWQKPASTHLFRVLCRRPIPALGRQGQEELCEFEVTSSGMSKVSSGAELLRQCTSPGKGLLHLTTLRKGS